MDFSVDNQQQESKRMYQQSLSWIIVSDELLLSVEGGHGVIWPLPFHPVGLHFLFSGFPSFIYAVLRPLPLIHLHDLLDVKKTGRLCIQCPFQLFMFLFFIITLSALLF